jgi:hypothetical protein
MSSEALTPIDGREGTTRAETEKIREGRPDESRGSKVDRLMKGEREERESGDCRTRGRRRGRYANAKAARLVGRSMEERGKEMRRLESVGKVGVMSSEARRQIGGREEGRNAETEEIREGR